MYTCKDCRDPDYLDVQWRGEKFLMESDVVYTLNLQDSSLLHEIVVPTCSYRMGEPTMGYGAAVIGMLLRVNYISNRPITLEGSDDPHVCELLTEQDTTPRQRHHSRHYDSFHFPPLTSTVSVCHFQPNLLRTLMTPVWSPSEPPPKKLTIVI